MTTFVDMGGDTLIVEGINVGATGPGQTGTALSSSELAVLDGASSANSTTGKVAILGTSGNISIAGTLTPVSGITAAAGKTIGPRLIHTGGNPPSVSTDFSDYTVVTTETIRAEVYVPGDISSTGVAIFNGSAVAGNLTAYLIDHQGTQMAATASTAQSGTDAYQRIAWTSGPVTVVGPASYWIAVQGNNTGGKVNTHTIGNFGADKQTSTVYGTLTVATAPTTFTTALGPVASLY